MSSESCESFSSESVNLEIRDYIPNASEVAIFLSNLPYVTDMIEFLSKLRYCKIASSDDMVLGMCGIAKYTEIRAFLTKNFKKTVNNILEKAGGLADADFLISARISNIPLASVLEMYSAIENEISKHVIIPSRLYPVEKAFVNDVVNEFPEFPPIEMRQFPYNSEEVFLLNTKLKQNTEVDGSPLRVFLVSKDEFKKFVREFANDVQSG